MTRGPYINIARARCNLLRDGVERTAIHARQAIRHGRGLIAIVIRDDGSHRSYRQSEVPECERSMHIGTYNARVSLETLRGDIEMRLSEITA